MIQEDSRFTRVAEILPDNDRTAAIRKNRAEAEAARAQEEEEQRMRLEKDKKEQQRKRAKMAMEKENADRARKEADRKREEQEKAATQIAGKLRAILEKLKDHQTPKEATFSGIALGGARTSILARHLAFNESLTALHLVRKNIQDQEGTDLANMLLTNQTLRKMELEGNCLGSKTAKALGYAIKQNTTLKFLDLESNQLSVEGDDPAGIMFFIDSLKSNKHLLSLNVANNKLDEPIGKEFRHCLEKNTTIIDFEFGFNQFKLEDVRKIQEYLRRNKAMYDKQHLIEWQERKSMRDENEALHSMYLKQNTVQEQQRMEEEAREIRTKEIDAQWKKMMEEDKIERDRMIFQLAEAAQMRLQRGKKGRKGKKGKKKK